MLNKFLLTLQHDETLQTDSFHMYAASMQEQQPSKQHVDLDFIFEAKPNRQQN